ncbi:MAG: matrixin family metalloprotease [Acidobacteriia bacterium]|nr:matrixin family metalloprotease [Terriglobia bacterium]
MIRRISKALAAWLLVAGAANAYYFFVHYNTRTGPFQAIPEKFDLTSLYEKTVPVLISDQGPASFHENDSYASLVSQIRLAARNWNEVPTSDLRLRLGGLFTPGAVHGKPVIEVVFEDLPPGLVAQGGPTLRADLTSGAGGPFVPILRSTISLPLDMSQRPSYSEAFFLTVSHEMGHAIGLQHSMTSGLMSTEVTRATTKAKPLAADDIAGVSILYPSQKMPAVTGTIAGRVLLSGTGVNLASVVALSPEGTAISAITAPDGAYRIEGLPPGSYFVYAHPLPPALMGETFPANIIPPVDLNNSALPGTGSFETMFYPGVKEVIRASAVSVSAGMAQEGIDFRVNRRTAPAVYAVTTYSFPGQVAVKPAHLSTSGGRNFILAYGVGLSASAGVSVMGGSAVIPQDGVRPYSQDPRFLQMDFQFTPFSGEGARHLSFVADNDTYVLPAGFRLTKSMPPSVTSVVRGYLDAAGNQQLTVSGTSFQSDTQVLFDGAAGTVRSVDTHANTIVVVPPLAGGRQRSAVVALNRDGQSSLFLNGSTPPIFEFDPAESGSFIVSPAQLPSGSDTMVEILGAGTAFQPGTTLWFGSADVFVRRVWVTGPNRMLANVVISSSAIPSSVNLTLANGLRLLTNPGGFQILPATSGSRFSGVVLDAAGSSPDIQAGAVATASLIGPAADLPLSALQLTVGGRDAAVIAAGGGQIQFRVPAELTPGPAIVRLTANGESVPGVVLSIDLPPPVIGSLQISGTTISAQRPARAGEIVTVAVSGLGDASAEAAASRRRIYVGSTAHNVVQISASPDGSYQLQFVLDASAGTGNLPLAVKVDNRMSAPVLLPVQ